MWISYKRVIIDDTQTQTFICYPTPSLMINPTLKKLYQQHLSKIFEKMATK